MTANNLYPLLFEPILHERIWGGRKLATLGKDLPAERRVGESWELCDLPGEQSVVQNGSVAGETLSRVIEISGDAVMGAVALDGGRFPLLVKFIDAARTLSVQVHPDEAACARLGQGRPKCEAWYVMAAELGAKLYLGLKPGVTDAEFRSAIDKGAIDTLLHAVTPQPGDLFPIGPGTLHAIGAGVLLAEIQQPSDTTFRVYDWGRVGLDGRPRELHVRQALQCTILDAEVSPVMGELAVGHFSARLEHLASGVTLDVAGSGPRVLLGLEGTASIATESAQPEISLPRGVVALVPACVELARVETAGSATVMVVTFPDRKGAR